MHVILQHNNQWLRFADPVRILETTDPARVLPLLKEAETSGLYAAGFISYEAAPAFDAALTTYPPDDFPLLCLGLFEAPEKLSRLPSASDAFAMGRLESSVSLSEYRDAVGRIHRKIERGETYQVNYTYRLRADFRGDPGAFFRQLVEGQELAHAAYVETADFAVCSASPELFFSYENGCLMSRPMKGTAPRGRTLAEDRAQARELRASEKDCAENIMIVDMIRNDIGRVAIPGTVDTPEMLTLEKYPTVWQMTSTVRGQSDVSVSRVMKALFPCASITGAPKVKTMGIIRDLETTPRKIYTGSVGFLDPQGNARFNVAIRTALIDRNRQLLEYGVGGGIVWDSDPDREYEETRLKSRVLTQPRTPFQLLETMRYTPDDGIFLLGEHLDRLARSADYFDFSVNMEAVEKKLTAAMKDCREQGASKLRLLVSKKGDIELQTAPLQKTLARAGEMPVVQVALAEKPVDSHDVFLYHKTTCRSVYQEALDACPEADDVILSNEQGHVTESCLANVVIDENGQFFTPLVDCGLLAGTFREHLLKTGQITERTITVEELNRATAVFLVNSVRRWQRAVLRPLAKE